MKIIKSEDISEEDFGTVIARRILNEQDYEKLSIAEVILKGKQEKAYNKVSDIFYYILEGEGTFEIKERVYSVKKGDLVCIPKNTPYKDDGKLKLLAISTPPFNPENHVFE